VVEARGCRGGYYDGNLETFEVDAVLEIREAYGIDVEARVGEGMVVDDVVDGDKGAVSIEDSGVILSPRTVVTFEVAPDFFGLVFGYGELGTGSQTRS
jgi:hypothetical protein